MLTQRSFLLVLLLFVGACGDPSSDTSSVDSQSKKQVFHRGNGGDPGSLDPHKSSDHSSQEVLRDLYEGLVSESVDSKIIPGVAKSWTISDDGLNYVFTLRQSAKWSNGDPLVAQDFVNGFRRAVDPKTASAYAQLLAPIENAKSVIAGELPVTDLGVTAPDTHTLVINLNNPTPYFLGLLTLSATYPIHTPSLLQHAEQFTRPNNLISNGPFRLVELTPQSHIKLVRNENYWDTANVSIDEVFFYNTENLTGEFNRYRAGELDFTYNIPPSQFERIKQDLSQELHVAPYLSVYYYLFDLSDPKFGDVRLRQALSMAIDRETLVQQVTKAGQVPAYGLVPPGVNNHLAHDYSWKSLSVSQRLEQAKALYQQAGFSENNPARFTLLYNTGEDHRNLAVAVAAMWKQNLGAEVTLQNQEFKVLLKTRLNPQAWEVLRFAWVGDYNDPNTFLEIFASDHGQNINGYQNDRFDSLLQAAAQQADLDKRTQMLGEAERLFMSDYAIVPLYYYVSKHLVKPHVKGFSSNIMKHNQTKHYSIAK